MRIDTHVILMQSYPIMIMFLVRTTMRLRIWPSILFWMPRANKISIFDSYGTHIDWWEVAIDEDSEGGGI